MAEIRKIQGGPQTSIGRRLFAQTAPLAGTALFGPAGGAVGSILGSKVGGASTEDALLAGAKSGLSGAAGPEVSGAANALGAVAPAAQGPEAAGTTQAGPSTPFNRRLGTLQSDPKVQIQEGLIALNQLPVDDPLRKKYIPPLIQAQMAGQGTQLA